MFCIYTLALSEVCLPRPMAVFCISFILRFTFMLLRYVLNDFIWFQFSLLRLLLLLLLLLLHLPL